MEEGCPKSERLSYTTKCEGEVVLSAEEKGNCKTAAVFEVDESSVPQWQKH
jgi:hypothetical protein